MVKSETHHRYKQCQFSATFSMAGHSGGQSEGHSEGHSEGQSEGCLVTNSISNFT